MSHLIHSRVAVQRLADDLAAVVFHKGLHHLLHDVGRRGGGQELFEVTCWVVVSVVVAAALVGVDGAYMVNSVERIDWVGKVGKVDNSV